MVSASLLKRKKYRSQGVSSDTEWCWSALARDERRERRRKELKGKVESWMQASRLRVASSWRLPIMDGLRTYATILSACSCSFLSLLLYKCNLSCMLEMLRSFLHRKLKNGGFRVRVTRCERGPTQDNCRFQGGFNVLQTTMHTLCGTAIHQDISPGHSIRSATHNLNSPMMGLTPNLFQFPNQNKIVEQTDSERKTKQNKKTKTTRGTA